MQCVQDHFFLFSMLRGVQIAMRNMFAGVFAAFAIWEHVSMTYTTNLNQTSSKSNRIKAFRRICFKPLRYVLPYLKLVGTLKQIYTPAVIQDFRLYAHISSSYLQLQFISIQLIAKSKNFISLGWRKFILARTRLRERQPKRVGSRYTTQQRTATLTMDYYLWTVCLYMNLA